MNSSLIGSLEWDTMVVSLDPRPILNAPTGTCCQPYSEWSVGVVCVVNQPLNHSSIPHRSQPQGSMQPIRNRQTYKVDAIPTTDPERVHSLWRAARQGAVMPPHQGRVTGPRGFAQKSRGTKNGGGESAQDVLPAPTSSVPMSYATPWTSTSRTTDSSAMKRGKL